MFNHPTLTQQLIGDRHDQLRREFHHESGRGFDATRLRFLRAREHE